MNNLTDRHQPSPTKDPTGGLLDTHLDHTYICIYKHLHTREHESAFAAAVRAPEVTLALPLNASIPFLEQFVQSVSQHFPPTLRVFTCCFLIPSCLLQPSPCLCQRGFPQEHPLHPKRDYMKLPLPILLLPPPILPLPPLQEIPQHPQGESFLNPVTGVRT